MKYALLILSLLFATYLPSHAQCNALWMGWNDTNLTAYFNETSRLDSNATTYLWDFGDNTSSTVRSPMHQYSATGNYRVCLTVETTINGAFCSNSFCDTMQVSAQPSSCTAAFSYTVDTNDSTRIHFSDQSQTGAGVYYYQWEFHDNNQAASTTQNPIFSYNTAGKYEACLRIMFFYNGTTMCDDTYCDTIVIGDGIFRYGLFGTIWSDTSTGVWNEAIVYLIKHDQQTQMLSAIDSTTTQNGQYHFAQQLPGDYLLKAALLPNTPGYNDYFPTYYQSKLFWSNATTRILPYNTVGPHYSDIDMIPGNNPGGPGFIGGNVNQGANKQASGAPIEGVQVMILNMDESPVQYTYTAADGSFSFGDVAYGTYKVHAEIVGKPTFAATVTLSATKESVSDVAIVVEEEGVYSAVTEVDVTYIGSTNLYPNPVADNGTLSFNAKVAGNVTLRVMNMLGQVVTEQEVDVLPGNQFAAIDMAAEQAGVYFLSISFNNHVAAHIRFVRE